MNVSQTLRILARSITVDGDTLLLHEPSGDIYLLNTTASLIWHGLSSGMQEDEIISILAANSARDAPSVTRDVSGIIGEWTSKGLIACGAAQNAGAKGIRDSGRWWGEPTVKGSGPVAKFAIARDYRVLDFGFRLCTGDTPPELEVHAHLAHLRVDAGPSRSINLTLQVDRDAWCLLCNGTLIDSCKSESALVPLVHANIVLGAYKATSCLAAVHAAAIRAGKNCILLAGEPGNGKTTLAARLISENFRLVADDTVLLSFPPIAVRGVPMRLGIKEGSWALLAKIWPELGGQRIYVREDGKRVRYFAPPGSLDGASDARPALASCLLFPKYRAGSDFLVTPLRTAQALSKLAAAGYDVPNRLNLDSVSKLLDWLAGLECFAIEYADADDVVHWIGEVLP